MAEGDFPKADGDRLFASEYNAVNTNIRRTHENSMGQITLGGTSPNYSRPGFLYDRLSTASLQTSTGLTHQLNAMFVEGSATYTATTRYFPFASNKSEGFFWMDYSIYEVYDEFSDGTVSSSLWTTSGAVSESNNVLTIGTGTNSYARTADLSTYETIYFKCEMGTNGGSGDSNETQNLILTDGTNEQNILAIAENKSGNKDDWYIDGQIDVVDWSSKVVKVTLFIHRELEQSESGGSFFTRDYVQTNFYTLSSHTALQLEWWTSNQADAISLYNVRIRKENVSTTATLSVTFDGGTTWDTCTDGIITAATTAGTSVGMRLTGTAAANEVLEIKSYTMNVDCY